MQGAMRYGNLPETERESECHNKILQTHLQFAVISRM